MTSMDREVVETVFRLLATAQLGGTGYVEIDATTTDGIASVTLLAVPTHVAQTLLRLPELQPNHDIGRTR